MPTYNYRCENCKKEFEKFHSFNFSAKKCPFCKKFKLIKLIGKGSGIIFRGSGFYKDDYKNK